jgi:glyoxylase-like metal-dependent hydrolase (beta-lactamase superfamily II)
VVDLTTRTGSVSTDIVRVERLRFSNCYLVREADGLTLVDTSLRGSAGPILRVAEELAQPIRRIAITHAHADHVGALDELAARTGAEVVIGEREASLLAGDLSPRPGERGKLPAAVFQTCKTRPSTLVGDGDRVGSLEVIAAPGHTPGQLALRDTRDGTLLCADAFYAIGPLFVTTELRWQFPFPALLAPWDGGIALATARRLADLAPSRLAAGHGAPVEEPVGAMWEAIARAERKRVFGRR